MISQCANPYAIETRYMLDRMGQLLAQQRPRRVRIDADDHEIVRAAVRRLAGDYRLSVATPALADDIRQTLGLAVAVVGDEPDDAAFAPLSLGRRALPREPILVGAVHNPISYKSLRYPRQVSALGLRVIAQVRRTHLIDAIVGMYPPRCAGLLALAALAAYVRPGAYFRLEDLAMRYIFAGAPAWRLSYVVIFAGRRSGR